MILAPVIVSWILDSVVVLLVLLSTQLYLLNCTFMREFSHLGQVLFMHAIALFHSDEHVLIAVIYLKCIILNLHFVASVDVA